MYDEVLNHMTVDELRNYVKHQSRLVEASQRLDGANRELVRVLKQLITSMTYQHECSVARNSRLDILHRVEEELEKKYDKFIPESTPIWAK